MTVPRRTELEAALRATKKDSAPGPDGVRYPQVKQLGQKEMQELADIINTSMESGKITEDQRDCRQAVLPNRLKDNSHLKGYSIITMANVLVKLMEKIQGV